jgi:uncharacterized membrane protein
MWLCSPWLSWALTSQSPHELARKHWTWHLAMLACVVWMLHLELAIQQQLCLYSSPATLTCSIFMCIVPQWVIPA